MWLLKAKIIFKVRTANAVRERFRIVTPSRNISTIQAITIDALYALSMGYHRMIWFNITAPLSTEQYARDAMIAMG